MKGYHREIGLSDEAATGRESEEGPDPALIKCVRWAFRLPGRGPEKNLPHFLAGTRSLEVLVGSVLFELRLDHSALDEGELAAWSEAARIVAEELRNRSRP